MKCWKALGLFSFITLLACMPVGVVLAGNNFLTLPFEKDPRLMQGWYYSSNFSGQTHQGIDYYSPIGTPLLASSGGIATRNFQSGSSRSYGNYVVINHDNGYKTLYAHLSEIDLNIKNGTVVQRGQVIGKTGMSGTDNPHLHFEALSDSPNGMGLNRGNGWRLDPYDLYTTSGAYPSNGNRGGLGENHIWYTGYPVVWVPPKPSTLTLTSESDKTTLSWTKSDDPQFDRYEIYRSTMVGGTANPESRALVLSTKEAGLITAIDDKVPIGMNYYRIYTYFKNGLVADSTEVSIDSKRDIIQITSNNSSQSNPVVVDGKVYFEDFTPNGNQPNRKLYYYDIGDKEIKSIAMPLLTSYAQTPRGAGQKVVYGTYISSCYRVYYHNLETSQNIPVSIGDGSCSQVNPDISTSGIVVWQQLLGSKYQIYYNDTGGSNGPTLLSESTGHQRNARIFEDLLVYKDKSGSKSYDLYLKNFATGQIELLARDTSDGTADIWDKYVVWENKGKVSMMDIETKEVKVIASSGAGFNPTVSEGKVAYTLGEATGTYLHVYDIKTGADLKIDFLLHATSFPSYGGGYVAWDDTPTWPSTDKNIFLTKH